MGRKEGVSVDSMGPALPWSEPRDGVLARAPLMRTAPLPGLGFLCQGRGESSEPAPEADVERPRFIKKETEVQTSQAVFPRGGPASAGSLSPRSGAGACPPGAPHKPLTHH